MKLIISYYNRGVPRRSGQNNYQLMQSRIISFLIGKKITKFLDLNFCANFKCSTVVTSHFFAIA